MTADRVVELGLGRRIDPGDVTPAVMLEVMTWWFPTGVAARVPVLWPAVLGGGGRERAATEIFRFAGDLRRTGQP